MPIQSDALWPFAQRLGFYLSYPEMGQSHNPDNPSSCSHCL